MAAVIRIHPADNVAVAVEAIEAAGEVRAGGATVTAVEAIPPGHKVAMAPVAAGDPVVKYGYPIGHATAAIAPGAHVHTHNVATNLAGRTALKYAPASPADLPTPSATTFEGFLRGDGRVGIRNEIWIVPTVGCVNGVAEALAAAARQRFADAGIDGVYAFTHPLGCSQVGEDHRRTQRILAGLVHHPNAAGVLVLGLGCEENHLASFAEVLGPADPARVAMVNSQDVDDEIAEGLRRLDPIVRRAAAMRRQSVPLSSLCIALKCGGSDGFSGITANPLVGAVADRIVAAGGSALLTEVPEMFGAEAPLLGRCAGPEVFDAALRMINDFRAWFVAHGVSVDKNPSPGNRAGGITTLEEKSLGCVTKGGRGPITDVLTYGQRVRRPGVSLVDGPGDDMVAVTTLAAAGAHLVLFTTGRGTPLSGPAPTIKVATNARLAAAKGRWIDFDAAPILAGEPIDTLADALLADVLAVAGGRRTANERSGIRQIAIFTDGVT
ncbi:MAG: altronate dehydratase, partial [Planctomycetes bacterium]|nr:altronate dehydratase [Planctomycetota bacterium]